MYDAVVDVPRLLKFYGDDEPLPHPALVEARDALSAPLRRRARRAVPHRGLCLYRDGHDSVAWHGDRIGRSTRPRHHGRHPLGGSPRDLMLRPRGGGSSIRVPAGHGDLVVMGGSCQRTWDHCVPKTARPVGPRISVQFRAGRRALSRVRARPSRGRPERPPTGPPRPRPPRGCPAGLPPHAARRPRAGHRAARLPRRACRPRGRRAPGRPPTTRRPPATSPARGRRCGPPRTGRAGAVPRGPAPTVGHRRRHREVGRGHEDVDVPEQVLEARLPRPPVGDHGDAAPACHRGHRERHGEVVAVDEDRGHAVEEPLEGRVARHSPRGSALGVARHHRPLPRRLGDEHRGHRTAKPSPAVSTSSTPCAAASRRTTSARAEPPTAVTSAAGIPSRVAVTAALSAGPPASTRVPRATTFSFAPGTRSTACTTSTVASPHARTRRTPTASGDDVGVALGPVDRRHDRAQ